MSKSSTKVYCMLSKWHKTQTFKEAIIGNKNMYAELNASYRLAPEGF